MEQDVPLDGPAPQLSAVRIMALFPPVCVDVDLYLPATFNRPPRLYSASAAPPSADDLERLLQRGITSLCVPQHQIDGLRMQLRELAGSDAEMPAAIRLDIAREAVKEDFSRAWRNRRPEALIVHAEQFSETVVEACRHREAMTSVLASLAAHDGDTFAHISNVCIYSVMLARSVGIQGDDELMQVGQAALLHDVGKRSIRADILKKPGPLTAEEREIINDHPRLGFEELCRLPDLSRDQLLTVYQHHERRDGSGYPVRLTGDEINWMAQLVAVVDVFDALTARRSYREPTAAENALEFVRRGMGKHFFPEYVECWTELVKSAAMLGA
jgi:HD-GYP domain-containing protein (c-di-GMP phosphodiesterase class II)